VGRSVDEDCDDGTRMSRPLHAKAVLAIEHGTNDLHVLVGSANLTTRGMGGQNREPLVQQVVAGGGQRAFDQAVKSLDAVLINRTRLGPAPPPDDVDLPLILAALRTLIAYFWPNIGVNAGMSRLTGELRVEGDLSRVTEIRAGDTPLKVTANTLNVALDADHPALQARVDGVWVDVPHRHPAGPRPGGMRCLAVTDVGFAERATSEMHVRPLQHRRFLGPQLQTHERLRHPDTIRREHCPDCTGRRTTHLTGVRPLRHQHRHRDELGPSCG